MLLPSANAYTLKGEHVLQLMVEKNNFPSRLCIQQKISFLGNGVETINMDYEQWVRYQLPCRFRSDINAGALKRIQVVSSNRSLTVIDGRIARESELWRDHYKDLFFYRSRKRLVERLEALGIDFSVTSLGRYDGNICYVIGAQYPDESLPQLWVAKDTFQPVRWIFEVSDEQGVVEQKEIRYGDWENHFNSRYPSKIEFYQGQNLIQCIAVSQVEINPVFSEDLFDIEQLKQKYATGIHEETDSTGRNDIKQRIDEFKKIYE